MLSLVDSHCHINLLDKQFSSDDVIYQAKKNGVEHMLCVSIDLESVSEIISLAKENDMISASVGVHPNVTLANEDITNELLELGEDNKVVAIGETGLDYFRSEGGLDWQRDRFRLHINVAKELNKPLIIHNRSATEDVFRILKEEGADKVGGVMHCFVEDFETAKAAIDIGFMVSFSGIVTFKNARELQDVARKISLDNVLIETDSPYLAPVPFRGKPNQPAYVRYVAEFIANLREEGLEKIAIETTKNYHSKFNTLNNRI